MARITTYDQGTVPCDQQILFVILPSKYKKIGNNLEVGTKFSTFALE